MADHNIVPGAVYRTQLTTGSISALLLAVEWGADNEPVLVVFYHPRQGIIRLPLSHPDLPAWTMEAKPAPCDEGEALPMLPLLPTDTIRARLRAMEEEADQLRNELSRHGA